jgi:hypothetical protein
LPHSTGALDQHLVDMPAHARGCDRCPANTQHDVRLHTQAQFVAQLDPQGSDLDDVSSDSWIKPCAGSRGRVGLMAVEVRTFGSGGGDDS